MVNKVDIKVHQVSFKLDVKRLPLPVTLSSTCPNCGEGVEHDLEGDHKLNYPQVGQAFEYGFYCGSCDHEWSVSLQLNISLEIPGQRRLEQYLKSTPFGMDEVTTVLKGPGGEPALRVFGQVTILRDPDGYDPASGRAIDPTLIGDGYPADWPRCPGCDRPAMDGHITCGDALCDEGGRRG